jgi:hypothetical protein
MRGMRCEGLYWHLAWVTVLAANLVLPAQLGWEVTRGGGRLGLVAAVVLLWAAGHLLLARGPALGEPLVLGGVVTAAAQFFPVLQLMAGLTSLWVVERLTGPPEAHLPFGSGLTDAKAFAATILTAAQVAIVALVFGPVVRLFAEFAVEAVFAARGSMSQVNAAQSPNTPSTTQHPRT